jgi:anti-sigma factor ChrR (cupin superfamily)
MATFRKQEDCPTSQQLLAYQLGDLKSAESRVIGRHLSACEFCTSEVDFYEHYPVAKEVEESTADTKMPEPLYELAESILNRKHGKQSIADMMKDIDASL